jgi:hypothetical protein
MSNKYKLKLVTGTFDALKVVSAFSGRLVIAQMANGEWAALNRRSCDPADLRNREERAHWARAQGIKPGEIENYVRRIKAAEKAGYLRDDIQRARELLHSHGYATTALKERGNAVHQ